MAGRRLAWIEWALIGAGVLMYLFALPHDIGSDGWTRYQTMEELFTRGHVSAARYGVIQSVLAAPLWALGRIVGAPVTFTSYFNRLVFLGTLAGIFLVLRRNQTKTFTRRFVLLLMSASMFPHHVQYFFGEVLTACAVFLGLLLISEGAIGSGSAALVIGIVNTPVSVLGAGLVALRRFVAARSWRLFVPVLAAVTLMLGEFWIRRGSPLAAGYEGDYGLPTILPYSGRPGFSYPLLLGVVSILFSFGKGLVFFAPGLVLVGGKARASLPRKLGDLNTSALWFLAGFVLAYAKWWSWYGGWFWGPRFFLFAGFPASLMLAAALDDESPSPSAVVLTLSVLLVSVWVGADGAVFGQANMDVCRVNDYQNEFLCWYTPEFSALIRPFVAPRAVGLRDTVTLAYFAAVFACLAGPFTVAAATALESWRRR
ncbi:MAG: hypothetical protein HY047_10595 [Acidobacteria bacterium]|nr:hypothetical protein [Acidobacteriota bacterium]